MSEPISVHWKVEQKHCDSTEWKRCWVPGCGYLQNKPTKEEAEGEMEFYRKRLYGSELRIVRVEKHLESS
jgi:hypothetical protein